MPFKTTNKMKRSAFHLKQKKAKDTVKRDERFRRRREEDKNPRLKEERLARNVPMTIDKKRTWDEVHSDDEDALGLAVDVERIKRRKYEGETAEEKAERKRKKAEKKSKKEEKRKSVS